MRRRVKSWKKEKKDPEAELEALKLQYEQDLNEFKIAQQGYATELENYERQLEEGQEKAADLNRLVLPFGIMSFRGLNTTNCVLIVLS